jgi:hypothetical protein
VKRDMNLIRKLMLDIESKTPEELHNPIEIEGYTRQEVEGHLDLLVDAGFIVVGHVSSPWVETPYPKDLSWKGHEFLDNARDNTTWNQAMDVAKKAGGSLSMEVLSKVLGEIAGKVAEGLMKGATHP